MYVFVHYCREIIGEWKICLKMEKWVKTWKICFFVLTVQCSVIFMMFQNKNVGKRSNWDPVDLYGPPQSFVWPAGIFYTSGHLTATSKEVQIFKN